MSTGPSNPLSAGMRIGNYVLQERIGQGAFAQVWKAVHHERSGRVVAVKSPTEPTYRKQLAREGRLPQRLLLLLWSVVVLICGCSAGPGGGGRSQTPDDGPEADSPANEAENVQTTVADVQKATWLVIGGSDDSLVTATAFAVDTNLLATNAHVVQGIEDVMVEPDAFAIIVQHETGDTRAVKTVWAHPEYDATSVIVVTPDVGLLGVDASVPNTLTLGDVEALKSLEVLDDVSLCGFPGVVTAGVDFGGLLTGDFHPRTTCLTGTISALRSFDPGHAATPENTFLLQYDLPTVEGTSGSAVFNSTGQVVGVHALGFPSEGDFNFGIRADKLEELLAWVKLGVLEGTELADISVENPDPEPPPDNANDNDNANVNANDPCFNVTCGENEFCDFETGECVNFCTFVTCEEGQTCNPETTLCE